VIEIELHPQNMNTEIGSSQADHRSILSTPEGKEKKRLF
jgi:hypothetical protein